MNKCTRTKIVLKIISFFGIGTTFMFLLTIILCSSIMAEYISAFNYTKNTATSITNNDSDVIVPTFLGVDDSDTILSKKIINETNKWNIFNNPYRYYTGLCEKFCSDIYINAGYSYKGECCAYQHRLKHAHKEGKIPKGALIFSSASYENGHRLSAKCDICGHFAGHVGIYIGNGLVVGSQIPYIQDINTWILIYGYGGWSTE